MAPLLVSDLPVFLRWRGEPPFGADELDQLTGLADRMVVDSGEWRNVPRAYAKLVPVTERTVVSDLAWRRVLAALWPGIAEIGELRVRGPRPEAHLLAGWLRARLAREVVLVHDEADGLEEVAVDGLAVVAPEVETHTQSDQLSRELDVFGRNPVYEQALASVR